MERIWLKSYPAGVPAEVDPNQYRSLIELFDASIRQFGDRPAYHSMGKHITFSDLEKLSRDFGAWLQSKGLPKGARVELQGAVCWERPGEKLFGIRFEPSDGRDVVRQWIADYLEIS